MQELPTKGSDEVIPKLARVIAVVNQKGGTGKTTTAINVAAGMALLGRKTLVVDLDAQCNASDTLRANMSGKTVLGALFKEFSLESAIQHTDIDGLDVVPASPFLAGTDKTIDGTGREYRLKESLVPVLGNYDFVILDVGPTLGILLANAVTAASSLLIPIQADLYSIQALSALTNTVTTVRTYCNPTLKIEGLVFTKFKQRTSVARDLSEVFEQLALKLKTRLFKTRIRDSIVAAEAQLSRQALYQYNPKSPITVDYKNLVDELLGSE